MARLQGKSSLELSTYWLKRTAKGKQFLNLLERGCRKQCDYDEAEGGLIQHCAQCRFDITSLAYELFILKDHDKSPVAEANARRVLGAKL